MPRHLKISRALIMTSIVMGACVNIPKQEVRLAQGTKTDMSPTLDMSSDLKELPDPDKPLPLTGDFFVGSYSLHEVFGVNKSDFVGTISVQSDPPGLASFDEGSELLSFERAVFDEGFELELFVQGRSVARLDNVRVDGWSKLVTGKDHTCGVSQRERVYCWGRNNLGQLGVRPGPDQAVPLRVQRINVSEMIISGSNHVVVLTNSAQLWGWGSNEFNQLEPNVGDVQLLIEPRSLNVVPGLPLGAGEKMSCYLPGEEIQCYGLGAPQAWPLPMNLWAQMSAAGTNACGINLLSQEPRCYVIETADTPTPINALSLLNGEAAAGVEASANFICAWSQDRIICQAQAQASNDERVGNSSRAGALMGREVFSDTQGSVISVALGDAHGCLINYVGELYCWGLADKGRLGIKGMDHAIAQPLLRLGDGWVSVASKHDHTCAVHESGRAMCWGENTYNQLGQAAPSGDGMPGWVAPPKAP